MLDDTSRKVLRVLFSNHFFHEFELDIDFVVRRSMRSEQQVKDAINKLVSEQFVKWNKKDNTFKVIRLNG